MVNHEGTRKVRRASRQLEWRRIGRNDVAYRLLLQDSFPSWGFCIANGATSVWERWDGWTPDKARCRTT